MSKLVNLRELKRQYQLEPQRCVQQLTENIQEGKLKPENFSIRDLFEALQEHGSELLYEMSFRRSGGRSTREIMEAVGASTSGDFSNITGQIVVTIVRDKYENPDLLWPQLVTNHPTEFIDGERVPGIGRIGDKAEKVEEGAEYPVVGTNEEWTDTPPTVKHGFRVEATREIIIMDRTGLFLERCGEGAYWAGVLKEKEVLDLATGQINNYNRNGVATNTYLTSGAYINDQTGNALSGAGNEWLALQNADFLFQAMTDPNTGEPIGIPRNPQLLVPYQLMRTAGRIVTATQVETVDMRANATTVRTLGPNPYRDRVPQVLSNQYVGARSGSSTKWFYGDFKRALRWSEVWDIETVTAADNNEVMFTRDVWVRHKVSYRGKGWVFEPRFATRNDT